MSILHLRVDVARNRNDDLRQDIALAYANHFMRTGRYIGPREAFIILLQANRAFAKWLNFRNSRAELRRQYLRALRPNTAIRRHYQSAA